MPKPIVCLSEHLRQFLELFRPCFRKRQWKYFVIVLLGLIECEERKTMTGLLRVVAEQVSLSGLSRFLNHWPWQPEAMAQTWLHHFRKRMTPLVQAEHACLQAAQPKRIGRPKATVVTGYLLFDDSVHAKPKGRKMGGLGKHYSATEQKVVSGHCLFTGLYVLLGQRTPLPLQLYRQRTECEHVGAPFASKVDLAVTQIEQFAPVAHTHTHVLIDSWYHCKAVRKAAQRRGWDVSGSLRRNRVMRIIQADGSREWIKLSDYVTRLEREDWVEITWPSAQGGQQLYAHVVRTWVRKLGPTLVLITRSSLDAPLDQARFWGSTLLEVDAQALADILAIRWDIETFFEYVKDLLGSDHYQVLTAQGILRFWTLIACLMCFLEEQRSTLEGDGPTCGDARRRIQRVHQLNLLTWLADQVHNGTTVEQLRIQLAL